MFQNEENSALLNNVLKANTETDQYKQEFSEATYSPEKLQELRERFNVKIRSPVVDKKDYIHPYQPPVP